MVLQFLKHILELLILVALEKDRFMPIEVRYAGLKPHLLQNLHLLEGVHLPNSALHLAVRLGRIRSGEARAESWLSLGHSFHLGVEQVKYLLQLV